VIDYGVARVPRVMDEVSASALIGTPVDPRLSHVDWSWGPVLMTDEGNGEPIVLYLPLDRDRVGALRRAVIAATAENPGHMGRGSVSARSRTFGYMPRRPVYGREGCQTTSLALETPSAELVLDELAGHLQGMLAEVLPERVAADTDAASPIDSSWRLGESLYSSGVINRSSQLPYHRDVFNYPVISAMPVLRRGMSGGYLHLPEYDLTVPCRDGWVVFFPGQQFIHGVTPMQRTKADGYRYSVVYYALKGMRDCHTAAVETGYARQRRTEREREMARRIAAGEDPIAGRDPRLRSKNSGRLIGGVSAFPNGDPTAIEDAYRADH
jgi:hypothetical protein